MTMAFKEQLGRLRRERNLSQEDLASKLYLSRQSISKWEQGETTPDLTTLVKLATILEVSLDELVLGQTITPPRDRERPDQAWQRRPMNGWEFAAHYWWLVFALMGMISWLWR